MKKRVLILCLAFSVSTFCMACGDNLTPATPEEPVTSESVEISEDPEAVPENEEAPTDNTGDIDNILDEGSDDSSGSKASDFDCSVFTDASYADVCDYAQKIKDLTLAKDWNAIGDMINYPVADCDGKVCKTKEDFVKYAESANYEQELFDSLEKWSVDEIWFNGQGACIDDGNIWFQDFSFAATDFGIKSFWGLYPQ